MYVLVEYEIDDRGNYTTAQSILGVFDHPDITKEQLESVYGNFVELSNEHVGCSEFEWLKTIKTNQGRYALTLLKFELNEL